MKKQLKNYIMIVCFLLFIFGFSVASFISEDREFSENENRYLQQAPEFSWKRLEKGEFRYRKLYVRSDIYERPACES